MVDPEATHHAGLLGWKMKELEQLELQVKAKEMHLENMERRLGEFIEKKRKLPIIYVLTPTYARPVQKAELTHLTQTLMHVPNLHWVVIEDSNKKTPMVKNLIAKSKLNYTHLCIHTPPDYKLGEDDPSWLKPRGVLQRNLGLQWIRGNVKPSAHGGVLYFADDDNTYDLEVFKEVNNR